MRYQSFTVRPDLLDGVLNYWTEGTTWSLFSILKLTKDKILIVLEKSE